MGHKATCCYAAFRYTPQRITSAPRSASELFLSLRYAITTVTDYLRVAEKDCPTLFLMERLLPSGEISTRSV